jgi:anti-anti-sigma factor
MDFTHKQKEGVLVISFNEKALDAKGSPVFKEKVITLITNCNIENVVFDLQKLQFIDSSGLGSFLSVLRLVNDKGGDLKLACMSNGIKAMFEIVRMHKLFEIFSTSEDAVTSFKR